MIWIWVLAALSGGLPAAHQNRNVDGAKYDKGAKVTIQGCVVGAEAQNSYILTGVIEWPPANSVFGIYGPRHYWLDESTDLSSSIGKTVQFKGVIIDLRESEIEREPSGWNEGTRVAIERPGQDIFTSPGRAGVPAAEAGSRVDVKITLLKLHVDEMLVVMQTCLKPTRPPPAL